MTEAPENTDSMPAASVENFEDRLPAWQRMVNGFLENWIFAFVIALVVRQFFLEPFVIPTASMEPMLLGSQHMTKADHVVVNKFSHRFSEAQRWDVTVFEFPIPEIHSKQTQSERQIWGMSSREPRSNWLSQPLQHRNFVKRLAILPGDHFFVAGGDIYVEQDGKFQVARKPKIIQDALWQCMYKHGEEKGYLPWSTGAALEDGKLQIQPGERAVGFTQPLKNLYMKPGIYRVHPANNFSESLNVEISMLHPLFQFHGRQGNAWDLDRWSIYRLHTLDLDSQEHGSLLNRRMNENIGDMRIRFKPSTLSGTINLEIFDRDRNQYRLQMTADAWQVLKKDGDTQELLFSGKGSVIGQECAFIRLDNQVWFEMNGKEMHKRIECARPQDVDHACLIRWSGNGAVVLDSCAVDRDVHYCRSGFLADLAVEQQDALREIVQIKRALALKKQTHASEEVMKGLEQSLQEAENQAAQIQSSQEIQGLVRERLLGRPLKDTERLRPIGDSPETSLTAPAHAYLMFGDNSPFSWDSRNWGWVPESNIRGRAAWVVFPVSRWKNIR